VPITLGQEMGAYASGIRRGIKRIKSAVEGAHVINMVPLQLVQVLMLNLTTFMM